jgi:hypothetical protein
MNYCCCSGGVTTCGVTVNTPFPCGTDATKNAYITYVITDSLGGTVASGANATFMGGGWSPGPYTRSFPLPGGNYTLTATIRPLTAVFTPTLGFDGTFESQATFVSSYSTPFTLACPTPITLSIPTTPTGYNEYFSLDLVDSTGAPYAGDCFVVSDSANPANVGRGSPGFSSNPQMPLSTVISMGETHVVGIKSDNFGVPTRFGTFTVTGHFCDSNDPTLRPTTTVTVS